MNLQRLIMFIDHTVDRGIHLVAFEPDDYALCQMLWSSGQICVPGVVVTGVVAESARQEPVPHLMAMAGAL